MESRLSVVVVGAGMAGASAAWHLAGRAEVTVVEAEASAGHHATGRSAALLTEVIGPPEVRALVRAGRPFFTSPPAGFADHRLVSTLGVLLIARDADITALEGQFALARRQGTELRRLSGAQCREMVPVLRSEAAAAGAYEPDAAAVDVDALLQGFVRGARRRGAQFCFNAAVKALSRRGDRWEVAAGDRHLECDVVVNAAGAWCDEVALMAGVEPLGLRPLRRSVFVFPSAPGTDISAWPLVADIGNRFYFEPWGGLLLASPADETLSEPCDARAEESDIAIGVSELQAATTLRVRGVRSTWAGLRTFAPDGVPVAGFDPDAEGFFWLAGQGGYGIKTSPALGRLAAALIAQAAPPELRGPAGDFGPSDFAPDRLR